MTNFIAKQPEINLTESEAIEKAKNGDHAAFEYLYKLHSKRVYGLCLRMSKHPAEAEELMQQAFLQLFRKIGTFRGESGLSTWLHRVTVNIVLMHLRRKKPIEIPAEDLERQDTEGDSTREYGSNDPSMVGALDRVNLKRSIDKLPRGYRQYFLLYDALGYKHREIAGLLGCSTGCSKSQLHKARKRLRLLLQGEESAGEAVDIVPA
ncbi:MAG TPA: RNA polymerase sigma factor [Candidatus Sulfotelmatobacter sp.]|jgi:RNA polymerase sigma-70 factor (ECF subfamily)|nr:RNA polymerase sigma factor [Candidatus Sulfotelmatobacter sp.]